MEPLCLVFCLLKSDRCTYDDERNATEVGCGKYLNMFTIHTKTNYTKIKKLLFYYIGNVESFRKAYN